jgi:hypothetical protein
MQQWQNVSIVKGGSQANTLVQIMKTVWGRTLFSRVLIQNIGSSLYKVSSWAWCRRGWGARRCVSRVWEVWAQFRAAGCSMAAS